MMKSGIDQQALIDQFASASAQQTAQLRSTVFNATLGALQGRELSLKNIRGVLGTVTQAASTGAAKNPLLGGAQVYERDGKSVCHNRWIAIRKGNRVCYAQWSDCGPFRTDHWEYVFGNETPKPNLNRAAGLDVSPSVRDYLGMGSMDVVDWKFVEARDVPVGPWARIGTRSEEHTSELQSPC